MPSAKHRGMVYYKIISVKFAPYIKTSLWHFGSTDLSPPPTPPSRKHLPAPLQIICSTKDNPKVDCLPLIAIISSITSCDCYNPYNWVPTKKIPVTYCGCPHDGSISSALFCSLTDSHTPLKIYNPQVNTLKDCLPLNYYLINYFSICTTEYPQKVPVCTCCGCPQGGSITSAVVV